MEKIGEVVKRYLKLYPNEEFNSTLARLIAKENPHLYKGKPKKTRILRVLRMIRYYKGADGERSREIRKIVKTQYFEILDNNSRWNQKNKDKELKRIQEKGGAKILVYDIETLPMIGAFWRLWKQNIGHKELFNSDLFRESWQLLTWSAKWLFEPEILSDKLTPKEIKTQDDSRILKSLCNLIEEADIIVAHNGNRFDIRQINARRLKHKMKPMLPFSMIDTYLSSKKAFDLPSHSLAYLANYLGVAKKMETGGMGLWVRCLNLEQEAIDEMERYNIQDVRVQEDVYLAIRPFIRPHPNIGLYIQDNVQCCPTCGGDIEWTGKKYATYANMFEAFRCINEMCGAIGRSRSTAIPTEAKRFLTMSIPK